MRLLIRTLAGLALLFVLTASASSQSQDESSARAKVLALEHAWNQAEAFKDLKALDTLFDNSLVYVDYDGTLFTKAEFLAHVKFAHVEQIVTESMIVEIFGNTAVVTGAYRATELEHGKLIARRGRFIDTWIFLNSRWVCVAAQAVPILR